MFFRAEDLGRYKSDNCIILENKISEAPCDKENPHYITLEKLLVDCVSDKIIKELIPSSEVSNIYENAKLLYRTNLTKIRRYAKRRNAWSRVEELLKNGETIPAETFQKTFLASLDGVFATIKYS